MYDLCVLIYMFIMNSIRGILYRIVYAILIQKGHNTATVSIIRRQNRQLHCRKSIKILDTRHWSNTNWSIAWINWVSRLTLLLPHYHFRNLRLAICYILKEFLPCAISFLGLYVINCICTLIRAVFWHTCAFSGYINRLCRHNNCYCWIGLCFLNLCLIIC